MKDFGKDFVNLSLLPDSKHFASRLLLALLNWLFGAAKEQARVWLERRKAEE